MKAQKLLLCESPWCIDQNTFEKLHRTFKLCYTECDLASGGPSHLLGHAVFSAPAEKAVGAEDD